MGVGTEQQVANKQKLNTSKVWGILLTLFADRFCNIKKNHNPITILPPQYLDSWEKGGQLAGLPGNASLATNWLKHAVM